MVTDPDIQREQHAILDENRRLSLSKKQCELKLFQLSSEVRGKRVSQSRYQYICQEQQKTKQSIYEIEEQLAKNKVRLREIARNHDSEKMVFLSSAGPGGVIRPIIEELVAVRDWYQSFAADNTRVSSMRMMAAEFVSKMTPIIDKFGAIDFAIGRRSKGDRHDA